MRRFFFELKKLFGRSLAIRNPLDTMPDFQNIQYQLVMEPAGSRGVAWGKLHECERRLELYKWVVSLNDPRKAQHKILLNDTVSALLMTFEATIQFLSNQYEQTTNAPYQHLGDWMVTLPQYDVTIRGMRTLRHFEAHVESKPPSSTASLSIYRNFSDGTSETNVSRTWHLVSLNQSDLNNLHHSPLRSGHLSDWNNLVSQNDAEYMFTDAIRKLNTILNAAESIV